MLALFRKLVLVAVLCLVVLFAYQNAESMSQSLRFRLNLGLEAWKWETPAFPLFILLGICFLLGMLTAGFHGIYERLARAVDIRKREKRIRTLERELGELRSQLAELRPPPIVAGGTSEASYKPSAEAPERRPRVGPPSTHAEDEPTL